MEQLYFTDEQVRRIEQNLEELFEDCVEIQIYQSLIQLNDGVYGAAMYFDGTDNKNNKLNIEFKCTTYGGVVADFDLVDIRGNTKVCIRVPKWDDTQQRFI